MFRKSSYSINAGACVEVDAFRKSSHSAAGNCVEVGAWRKSTRSNSQGACVEVGNGQRVVAVRDTTQARDADRVTIEFPADAWQEFTRKLIA